MSITVAIRSVYGVEAVYPVCDKARWFTQISGCKTLRKHDIEAIKALGFTVNVQSAIPATL